MTLCTQRSTSTIRFLQNYVMCQSLGRPHEGQFMSITFISTRICHEWIAGEHSQYCYRHVFIMSNVLQDKIY